VPGLMLVRRCTWLDLYLFYAACESNLLHQVVQICFLLTDYRWPMRPWFRRNRAWLSLRNTPSIIVLSPP
jgi:hypothetical protein